MEIGHGPDEAGGGFIQARYIKGHLRGYAWLDEGHAGELAHLVHERERGALEAHEDIGEVVGLVIFEARGGERMNEAARHDEHGQPAGHDERDGDGLAAHAGQVAQEFAIEVGEHLNNGRMAGARRRRNPGVRRHLAAFGRDDMSARPKARTCPRTPNHDRTGFDGVGKS